MPFSLVMILLFVAILFHRKRAKLSFNALLAATVILLFSSLSPISDTFMASLENSYPPFTRSVTPVDYIVVLGCTHTSIESLPATSQLKTCSLQRLVEAIRIYRLHPEAQIITSGYAGSDVISNATKMKQAAILLGVPGHKIITENFPKDTEEEAELIAPRIRNKTAVLVTNANHLPRAMKYFEIQGIDAIPAPTGFWVKDNGKRSWQSYVPSASKLQQTTTAWYETLGRIVQWFKTKFN